MRKSQTRSILISLAALIALGPSLVSGQPARDTERWFRPALEEFLNLTPEQKAKVEEFWKGRQEERKAFFEQMQKLQAELQELRKDPQPNEKKINALIDEMFQLRATRMKKSFKDSQEFKKIFTPEQLEKMEKFRPGIGPFMGGRMGAFWHKGGRAPGWGYRPFWGRGMFPRQPRHWWRW